mgnify:CR=1 FL=1
MKRRDLPTFEEIEDILINNKKEEGFSFFTDDITEDLKYK